MARVEPIANDDNEIEMGEPHNEIEPEISIEYVNDPRRRSSHESGHRAQTSPPYDSEEVKCNDIIIGALVGFLLQICGLCCVGVNNDLAFH